MSGRCRLSSCCESVDLYRLSMIPPLANDGALNCCDRAYGRVTVRKRVGESDADAAVA